MRVIDFIQIILLSCVIIEFICICYLRNRKHDSSTYKTYKMNKYCLKSNGANKHICKYELFDRYRRYEISIGPSMVYVFSCKECRKTKEVTSRDIFKIAKKYQQELKEKQFYENFIDVSKTRLIIGHISGGEIFTMYENYLLEGYVADKTIDHFKRLGIDVSVCNEYVDSSFVVFDERNY